MRQFFLALHIAVMAAMLAGLVVRGMRGAPNLLPAYVIVGLTQKILFLLWPGRFYVWSWWLVGELASTLLALGLALQLGVLVFGRLPVGRRRLAELGVVVLLIALVVIIHAPAPAVDASVDSVYYQGSLRASQATAAAGWIFAAILGLSLQHGVPLERMHRDVAAGLALWALLQGFASELSVLDPFLAIGRQGLHRLVYTGMLVAWAIDAWRRDEETDLGPEALRLLRPWRVTS
jgi:hypothetical protein